ncbi:MAG: hypothetical protein RDV41_15475 [Planctomycetota bacterium]|nr:hypothetical protein [Planctomycetota bacterium]
MRCNTIMAVTVSKRTSAAPLVQQALTKHGCIINLRVGLHETDRACEERGLILLHLCGTAKQVSALKCDLNRIKGARAKTLAL